jgi:prepilin-type N-terminal cleavage/methylation domain-containing protein
MTDRSFAPGGITLIELLVALAVLAVLLAAAAPAFTGLVDRLQLRGAADALYSDLLLARLEALRRNVPVGVAFGDGPAGAWCHALTDRGACDCFAADACALAGSPGRSARGSDFPRVSLATNFPPDHAAIFNPARGTATAGTTHFSSAAGSIDVVVSSLGRVRLCSERVPGYPPC